MKRLITAILMTALLIACFAGCTDSGVRSYTDPGPEPGAEATATVAPAATDAVEATATPAPDYTYAFEAFEPDTLVMEVDGSPVYWKELFYWINDAVTIINAYYSQISDWDAPCELDTAMSNQEYVKTYAFDVCRQYKVLEAKAAELGIGLTAEDEEYLETVWQENIDYYGSEEALQEQMDALFLDREMFDYINEISLLYTNVFIEMYGEAGSLVSEEEAVAFGEQLGYLRVKHILLSTQDAEGNALTEEEAALKLEAAEVLLEELGAITDAGVLEARFDELAAEHSEDTGLEAYPEGYCFTEGDMVEEFMTASSALEEYRLSEVVQSDFGYHIILRLPLRAEDIPISDGMNSLRYLAAWSMFDANISSWIEESELSYADGFEQLDLNEVF